MPSLISSNPGFSEMTRMLSVQSISQASLVDPSTVSDSKNLPPILKSTQDFRAVVHSPFVLFVILLLHGLVLIALLDRPAASPAMYPPKILSVSMIVPPSEKTQSAPPKQKTMPARSWSIPLKKLQNVSASKAIVPSVNSIPLPETAPETPNTTESQQTPAQADPLHAEVDPAPVVPPRYNADYLDNPEPPYPVLSQRLKEEGEVRLRVWVDAAGAPSRVALYRSSGFERLDRIALETVQRWRFTPARQGDQAIAAQVIVPVTFNLKD